MQKKKRPTKSLKLIFILKPLFLFLYLSIVPILAQDTPPVPDFYQKFFVHYTDNRSYREKILNAIGLTDQYVGRSFALIAGVSYYPNMMFHAQHLKPAAIDILNIQAYLTSVEFFDEIVVLKNHEMNDSNLKFFLQCYFPERFKKFPKSRFLFAYSGHGFSEGTRGYFLLSPAKNFSDKQYSINLEVVRVLFNEIVESGHHVLALINACYSGSFIRRQFGDKHFIPQEKGAHAITAGGTRELTWHDPNIGQGSIFFEKIFRGLSGFADILPQDGDGVITVDELYAYLHQEVQISTDHAQNPLIGDLTRDGSRGGFFFLNRDQQIKKGLIKPWDSSENFGIPEPIFVTPGFLDIWVTFHASGFMGDGKYGQKHIKVQEWEKNPYSEPDCIKIAYIPGKERWGGVYWLNETHNWGDSPGKDLSKYNYKKITFWVKGEKGGEIVEFKAGGIETSGKTYKDSFRATTSPIVLKREWKQYTISLEDKDISGVIGGFCWVANADQNPDGVIFYLDDIRYEPAYE